MTDPASRWRRVEQICEAALERSGVDRAAFLRDACGDDEALRREVEQLLAQESDAEGFLQGSVAAVAAGVMATAPQPLTGRRLDALEVADNTGDFALAESTTDVPSEQQATPQVLPAMGRWGALECRRKIAGGSFGAVYLAWDPALEREVALKVLPAAGRSHTVIQEGRLLARVRHPNVVTVYGIDEHDGTVALWMEWVEGLTLTQVLTARGLLGGHEASLIGIDVCRAVAAVHKAGLLHRDIKAQNVMLEAGGRIVLMDFGAGEIRSADSLAEPQMIGTPLYLAPELFAGHPATIASDIYSVGVLLYHLMTARFPVEGGTFGAIAGLHARQHMIGLSERRPDLPPGLVRIVEDALARDPARRYRSAEAMEKDLLSVLEIQNALDEAVAHETTTRRRRGSRLSPCCRSRISAPTRTSNTSATGSRRNS